MKIYRAILRENNGDILEYEKWFCHKSKWYVSKELAEKHLDELSAYAEKRKAEAKEINNWHYRGGKPFVEEVDVYDDLHEIMFENTEEE